jgi:ATP-dependent DNA helicase RecG
LAQKGGKNCDVLLMSATPIPRTMMMSLYGDMDISKITEKPAKEKNNYFK